MNKHRVVKVGVMPLEDFKKRTIAKEFLRQAVAEMDNFCARGKKDASPYCVNDYYGACAKYSEGQIFLMPL